MRRLCFFTIVAVASVALCACHRPDPRPVEITGIKNITRNGNVYIAGAPTEPGLRELKSRGVTTIIDLRGESEGVPAEREVAQSLGLHYIHIPMASDDMTADQATAIVAALKAHQNEPVLLHCAGGNRAGAAYGLYLGATGRCSPDDAIHAADVAGLKNPKLRIAAKARILELRPASP
jgi:uncharacterized protein (TIGR01244 family)